MQRREVLRAAGAITAGGLAGCGGAGVDGSDGNGTDPTDSATTTTAETRTTTEAEGGDDAAATTTTSSPPSMGTPELTAGGSDCLSGEEHATVTFGDGSVTVEGTVAAPNPCHEPELSASSYDEEGDELSLTVAAVEEPESERVCAACVGGIEYTLTVPFENGLPGGVTVTHDGIETGTVAEASRGE